MAAEQPVIAPDPFLGSVLSHHPSDRLKPLLVAALIGAPIAVLLALTSARTEAWWGMPVTVGGVAITGLALGWYVLHVWNREVVLYQRGFSYREGSTTVYFTYSELKWVGLQARRMAYFRGLLRRDVYTIDVWTRAGDHIQITNLYRRVSELASRFTEQADRVLRPEIERRLQIGEVVEFGEGIAIDRDKLIVQGRQLAWKDFGGYRVGGGKLTLIKRDGTTFDELPLPAVYNIAIFTDYLRQHKTAEPPQLES